MYLIELKDRPGLFVTMCDYAGCGDEIYKYSTIDDSPTMWANYTECLEQFTRLDSDSYRIVELTISAI